VQADRFTVKSQEALAAAQRIASARRNSEVAPAHLLVALLEQEGGIVVPVLRKVGADPQAVRTKANQGLDELPTVTGEAAPAPSMSAATRELLRRAACSGTALELLGMCAPAQVCAALEQADVLAMPCVVARDGDRDSMPVVVKEAMAMELLVVASDEVGLPECARPPWGFLAPPGDAAALAQALDAALELEPGTRRRAGAQAREWVTLHADVDAETARMSAVIAQLGG